MQGRRFRITRGFMSNDRDIAYAAFFCGYGVWAFFRGFARLRRERLIENIPTSTVRGLAMGLVELIGQAEEARLFKAPLTDAECVYYRYTVERYQSSGRSSHWVTVAKGDSGCSPFWLKDATGKIMVFPQGAEVMMPIDYQFETGLFASMPETLSAFMRNHALGCTGTLRFKEWRIEPEEMVYVLGTARNTSNPAEDHKNKLLQRLEALKDNPRQMAEVDSNKDGTVSIEEWDKAVNRVEQALIEEELKSGIENNGVNVIIDRGDAGEVFILSDEDQTQITKSLSWQAFFGVFGGAALSLAMLAYLLFRFGVWNRF